MPPAIRRLFGEGHRVFFLSAGLFAVFSMLVWTGWIAIHAAGGMVTDMPFAQPPHLWHAHEMVFGYGAAAMGGFFLTAVPNWTGAKAARHAFLAGATALWLAGRMAMWFSGSLPPLMVALADLAFLPLLGAKILTQLLQRPKPQNMMFLGVLALIWLGNLLVHLEWLGWGGNEYGGLRLGLYATCALIAVLGGRVVPAFTRNAMLRAGRETGLPHSPAWLDGAGIALPIVFAVAVAIDSVLPSGLPAVLTGGLALMTGAAVLARMTGWRSLWTRRQPILWSLHAGFALLGLGYLATGLAALGAGSEVAALHVLGIGAVGGMTLAVMSRASLGHSGRPLIAPPSVALAYGLVLGATLARWAGSSLGVNAYYAGVLMAGILWIAAFACMLAGLWPAFWGPRADGRPSP